MKTPGPYPLLALLLTAMGANAPAQTAVDTYTFASYPGLGNPSAPNAPAGLAVDAAGNVYFADTGKNAIRKISPQGDLTTLAGGAVGSSDGTGAAAQFNGPTAIAVDGSGNLYVADTGNDTIREVSPQGVVTTLAGSPGVQGSNDGTGSAAQFSGPAGIAVDGGGNVFVADTNNSTIRKIAAGGVVTTFAGTAHAPAQNQFASVFDSADGNGAGAQFDLPMGLAFDAGGNLYVADSGNGTIREINRAAGVTTYAGTAYDWLDFPQDTDGTGPAARFVNPEGVALDGNGNLYVADTVNGLIRKIAPGAVVTTYSGTPKNYQSFNRFGAIGAFFRPAALGVNAGGVVFVADTGNSSILEVLPGGLAFIVLGTNATNGGIDTSIAVDSGGNIYIADPLADVVQKLTPEGVALVLAKGTNPQGGPDVIVQGVNFIGGMAGVALDGNGNVFYTDSANNTVGEITAGGVVTTIAGTSGVAGSADGTGPAAQFNDPTSIAVDGGGNLYVADTVNNTIRKIAPGGGVTTIAGTAGVYGSADGTGSAAQFDQPQGVATDGAGNVYIADTGNNTVRRMTPGGVVTTLAGTPLSLAPPPGSSVGPPIQIPTHGLDGTGPAAQFYGPTGLAVDAKGNVFVSDTYNQTVRMITPAGAVTTIGGILGNISGTVFNSPQGAAVNANDIVFIANANGGVGVDFGYAGTGAPPGLSVTVPGFTAQPLSQTVGSGSTVVFTASASGAQTYQWFLNGNPVTDSTATTGTDLVSGATGPQLVITKATAASAGSYTVIATNGGLSTAPSSPAVLSVVAAPNAGTVVNFSARGYVGTGDAILIGGFYIAGSTARTVLIQGLGPALAGVGVNGVLQHPALTIHDSTGATIYSNAGWGSSPVLLKVAASVYAGPVLQSNSNDSELLVTLPPGGYTAEIVGADGGTGVALCAIYQLP
jgi:sugar lactone lactonase YvrE